LDCLARAPHASCLPARARRSAAQQRAGDAPAAHAQAGPAAALVGEARFRHVQRAAARR